MQLNKILLLFLIVLMKPLSLYSQCESVVNQFISIEDFPIESEVFSTENSGNDFIVFTADNTTDAAVGYANNDYIFQFTLGYEDIDPLDPENNENAEAVSIFVDMCNDDVSFDASIAIIKAQAHDNNGNPIGIGIECSNISIDSLIITHENLYGSYPETLDSESLCPQAANFSENPNYLPIARDIYLHDPGIYYIVVDGHSPDDTYAGNFSLVVGEMSYFEDYPYPHQPQNLYVDIEFSNQIYSVNDNQPWTIGEALNASEYFRVFDDSGNNIEIVDLQDLSGNVLLSDTGYDGLRFVLNNQPNYGASIFITTIDHDFIYNNYVLTAPHPVNGYGIPFSIGDTIEVELHDIIPPVINIEGVSDNGNPGIIDPDESFIIISSESLLRDGVAITGDSLDSYITAKYVSDDTPIVCTISVDDDHQEITVQPNSPMSDRQWEEVLITFDNEVENIKITDDPEILHDHENCPPPNTIDSTTLSIRVNDIILPTFDSVSLDDETNTLITITMSEAIYSELNESGGLDATNFELSLSANASNNVQAITIENVIQENSIQTLVGGDTIFRLQLILEPPQASGSEVVTISPTISPIYDRAGNQVLNQQSFTFNDELPPSLSFEPLSSDPIPPDTDFVLTFSESIKKYQASDTSIIDLEIGDIDSIIYLINQSGDTLDYNITFDDDLNETVITITPVDNLNELEQVTLSILGSVFSDQGMNLVPAELIEYVVADITPPNFENDTLGYGNDYVRIEMSEGIYTDPDAAGAVTVDDFELVVDYGDLTGAEYISIESIADTSGGSLIGGETVLRLNLNIVGPPNGTEKISVQVVPNEIYDSGGNVMSTNEESREFYLSPAPIFSQDSNLSPDNGFIKLIFENGPVFTNEDTSLGIITQDFMVQLTYSNGNITEITPLYIIDENFNLLGTSGADSARLDINLDFIPNGGETIMIFPESSNAIYNNLGVNMDESESVGPFTLHDQFRPFYNLNIVDGDSNISSNDTIILAFNEPIRLLDGQPLTDDSAMENIIIMDVSRSDNMVVSTPDGNIIIPPDSAVQYLTYYTIVNDPSPDSIWVIMTQPFGSEHNMALIIKDNIEDFSENQLSGNDTIAFKSRDNIPPDFINGSARIDSTVYFSIQNNPSENARKICFVDLSINDNIFTDSLATEPIQATDFIVEIIKNSGSVNSGIIENIELVPTGHIEKDSIRFKIRFDEVPSGHEGLLIRPANNNSIFDSGFNFMSPDSTSDTLTIYDLRFPTIDSTSIAHEGFIDLMSDSTILVYFSEPIVTNAFRYELKSKLDASGFKHTVSLSPDSLTILLDTTIMSYDTLELNIVSIKDTSGNERDSLLERRFFTKAAGDFSMPPDDRVGLEDLAIFISAWNSGDYTKNLGPYVGSPPNIKITQDSLFGIDDGMVFTQMWLWSLQKFGPTEVVQQLSNNSPSSIFMSGDLINILPPREAISGQIKIEYDQLVYTIIAGENNEIKNGGILLSNYNDQIGMSMLEYSIAKNKNSTLDFIIDKHDEKDSEIRISYLFFDDNFRLISKGDSVIHKHSMPTEFSLMQNYPNPFNPSTNIRFSIPKDSYVRLYVYDINGKIVDEIINGYLNPGVHNVEWRGTDIYGREVSSGVYFYSIESPEYSKSYKMVFVK